MKLASVGWISVVLSSGLLLGACSKPHQALYSSMKDADAAAQLRHFVAEKESQAKASTNKPATGFAPFFEAAEKGDWLAVSNDFQNFRKHAGQFEYSGESYDERLRGTRWEVVKEIWGAFDAFDAGDEKYSAAFGRDIIASIPPGSIYFGGTDAGRFIITALCRSQVDGDPFFVLTQNALADRTYLDYLRRMYGSKIYIPSRDDSQHCFEEYLTDLRQRFQKSQLKPGESYQPDASGKPQIIGQVEVMGVNALLAKMIFDKNPKQEFFVEESFPLDWMYPQLEPHGLIFKLNRQPMAILPDDIVQTNHVYWTKYIQPMIGNWLNDNTPVAEVAVFAKNVFGQHDYSDFKGDSQFIQNAYSHQMFSKLRSSIAGLYAWRASNDNEPTDQEHMAREADFAFRQAWTLCPYSPEATYRYINFLVDRHRIDDAVLIAETMAAMPQTSDFYRGQVAQVIQQLKRYKDENRAANY